MCSMSMRITIARWRVIHKVHTPGSTALKAGMGVINPSKKLQDPSEYKSTPAMKLPL